MARGLTLEPGTGGAGRGRGVPSGRPEVPGGALWQSSVLRPRPSLLRAQCPATSELLRDPVLGFGGVGS